MSKNSRVFRCTKCDSQFAKWQGRCSECGSWGTIAESQEVVRPANKQSTVPNAAPAKIMKLSEQGAHFEKRTATGIDEVDRVLGGGLVEGSVYLVGGDPGVGKSTLLLQVVSSLTGSALYVSGEESIDQIKNRVTRLGLPMDHVGFISETDLETILATIASSSPSVVVLDSIQTIRDATLEQTAGSVTQVKTVTAKLVSWAKENKVTLFIVGHVTKSGGVAGPKTMEHLVDGVLYIEGSEHYQHRVLRSTKNRFGSIDEIGVFTVDEKGFHPALEPAKMFLRGGNEAVAGSVITPVVEGTRIFFVEYQALVSRSGFGYPVRKSVGFDQNRLHMLLAVLVKRLRLPLDQFDVHLNVAGGVVLEEPSCDAATAAAIYSALQNKPVHPKTVVFGEVGLAGEIRMVPFLERRILEARRLGFTRIICPSFEAKEKKIPAGTVPVGSLKELVKVL